MRRTLPSELLLATTDFVARSRCGLDVFKLKVKLKTGRLPTAYACVKKCIKREMIFVSRSKQGRDGRPLRIYKVTPKGRKYVVLYRKMLALE